MSSLNVLGYKHIHTRIKHTYTHKHVPRSGHGFLLLFFSVHLARACVLSRVLQRAVRMPASALRQWYIFRLLLARIVMKDEFGRSGFLSLMEMLGRIDRADLDSCITEYEQYCYSLENASDQSLWNESALRMYSAYQ